LVAERGGTESAFVIDTGNPEDTSARFKEVVDSIRETSFSCAVHIPDPPEGKAFDPTKVNVVYTNTVGETPLVRDDNCAADFAWRYDDPNDPDSIEMCESVCEAIKNDHENQGELSVQFGCETRVDRAN